MKSIRSLIQRSKSKEEASEQQNVVENEEKPQDTPAEREFFRYLVALAKVVSSYT